MRKSRHEKCFINYVICAILITSFGCNEKNKSYIQKIEIPKVVNMGKVTILRNQKNKFEIEIPIKNLSENEIKISKIQTSCNCVVIDNSNKQLTLNPKESSTIKIYFMPTELDYGYIERIIFIYFYGYKSPALVTLTANVID